MSFAAHLERVARRIGINVLAIELHRTQRQHPRSRGSGIFHHDVQVKLLRHCRIRPGPRQVTRRTLERQARGYITGSDHQPVVITIDHRQPQQR
jgi:hypothetical protein